MSLILGLTRKSAFSFYSRVAFFCGQHAKPPFSIILRVTENLPIHAYGEKNCFRVSVPSVFIQSHLFKYTHFLQKSLYACRQEKLTTRKRIRIADLRVTSPKSQHAKLTKHSICVPMHLFLPSFYPTLQKSANIPMPLISSSLSALDSLSAPVWLLLRNHRFLEGAQKIPGSCPPGKRGSIEVIYSIVQYMKYLYPRGLEKNPLTELSIM